MNKQVFSVLGDIVFKKLLHEYKIHTVQSNPFVLGVLIILKSMSMIKAPEYHCL